MIAVSVTAGSCTVIAWSSSLNVLTDVIVLALIANPDGMELVSNWYMRQPNPTLRSLAGIPTLYQKYAGHDDNRDFYMSALPETRAINTVLYRDWMPQIVYDHHQSGPEGTVMFSPPFRDPFNFNFDPLVMTMLDEVAGAGFAVGDAGHHRKQPEAGRVGEGLEGPGELDGLGLGQRCRGEGFAAHLGWLDDVHGNLLPKTY